MNPKKNLSRQMLGAKVVFNGDEDAEQLGVLRSGAKFSSNHLKAFCLWSWVWNVSIEFVFKNGKLPLRCVPVSIVTDKPVKLDDLTDLVLGLQTEAALGQPEGYKYETKKWTATIERGAV